MAETKHHGGCHCGVVRYTVDLDLANKAIICNCSICGRSGTMLQLVALGDDQLTNYQFHRHHIDHVFCSVCGIKAFARGMSPKGERMIAVNVRCLDAVGVFTQPTQQFEGKNL